MYHLSKWMVLSTAVVFFGCSELRAPLTSYETEVAAIRQELDGGECREEFGENREGQPYRFTFCVESGTSYRVTEEQVRTGESNTLTSVIRVDGQFEGDFRTENAVRFLNFFDRYKIGPYEAARCREFDGDDLASLLSSSTEIVACSIFPESSSIEFSVERVLEQ